MPCTYELIEKPKALKQTKNISQVTITGIVTPVAWAEDGTIVRVNISTPQEREYLVQCDDNARKLLRLVHERVRVTGTLSKDKNGGNIIAVKRIEVLDELLL